VVVEGSGENIKVTRPEDLVIGEAILNSRTGARSAG
jgi:2-C-methyl-D-erythritol 4-phosphate cytidylyltransferase